MRGIWADFLELDNDYPQDDHEYEHTEIYSLDESNFSDDDEEDNKIDNLNTIISRDIPNEIVDIPEQIKIALSEAKKVEKPNNHFTWHTYTNKKYNKNLERLSGRLKEHFDCPHCGEGYEPRKDDDEGYLPVICKYCDRRMDLHWIVKTFGSWAVTLYGIEHLQEPHKVYRPYLFGNIELWVEQMSEKRWINLTDFAMAFEYGRKFFYPELYFTWYEKYLNTDHWQKKRKEALEYHQNRCMSCKSILNINVHHRNYDSLGHEDVKNDLIVLCRKCHCEIHNKC